MTEFAFRTATELSQAIRSKEISSLELTDLYIAHIEKHHKDINAVVVRDFECGREATRQRDGS